MGLFDSFRSNPPAPQQDNSNQNPNQNPNGSSGSAPPPPSWNTGPGTGGGTPQSAGWAPPQNQNQNNNSGGGTGNSNPGAKAPAADESPLDMFAELWQPNANQSQPTESKIFSFDPAKMGESVNKLNFAGSVKPELMQKALQGDTAAFGEALNGVARSVFGQSLQLMTNMMEHGFKKHGEGFEAKLPDMMREWGAGEELNSNPLFQHPSTKPVLDALKKQIASKHPELPAKEVARTAEMYFERMAEVIQGSKAQKTGSTSKSDIPQGTDFSTFLDFPS